MTTETEFKISEEPRLPRFASALSRGPAGARDLTITPASRPN